jgi:hypothetical protein
MEWIANITYPKPMSFVIKGFTSRDIISGIPVEGYYIYVYENGRNVYDYLQDSLEQAKDFAFRKFQVPTSAWKQI